MPRARVIMTVHTALGDGVWVPTVLPLPTYISPNEISLWYQSYRQFTRRTHTHCLNLNLYTCAVHSMGMPVCDSDMLLAQLLPELGTALCSCRRRRLCSLSLAQDGGGCIPPHSLAVFSIRIIIK